MENEVDNKEVVIEKGIPMKQSLVYPFGKMAVGDSFLVSDPEKRRSCSAAASKFARKLKNTVSFSVYKTHDGYRCWRVT